MIMRKRERDLIQQSRRIDTIRENSLCEVSRLFHSVLGTILSILIVA